MKRDHEPWVVLFLTHHVKPTVTWLAGGEKKEKWRREMRSGSRAEAQVRGDFIETGFTRLGGLKSFLQGRFGT